MQTQRAKCLYSIYNILKSDDAAIRNAMADAVEIEHAAYIVADGCKMAYPFSVLRVIHFLQSGKIQRIRYSSASQYYLQPYIDLLKLPADHLHCRLPCQEECNRNEQLRNDGENLLRDLSSHDLSHIPNAGTRCSKCNSSDIAFDFLQTRSADEGTTVYCTCTSCGKRWKM